MEELLKKFENKRPEIVFEWKDSETEAEGWVVINSLRNGAAGGGTRMRKGLDKREVESLAKTMEVKFTIAGPPIGGAKSGINFDPADPRKEGVLRRWYAAVMPMLRNYYGTGGDMNVDQYSEVIPYTADLGVLHPQEGVVQGYYKNYSKVEKLQAITRLQSGVLLPIIDERFTPDASKKYNVSDMITGWGVSEGVRHYYELWGGTMNHKTAIIQGWGNVSAAAAFYLAKHGVKIVGIIDREGGLINKEGYSLAEVTDMFINRDGNKLNANTPGFAPFAEVNAQIWELGAEIFIPGAGSRLVTKNQVTSLIDGQCEVISCGANVPFADPEIFLGEISMYADANIAVVPDFIANCGMARTFGFLMSEKGEVDDVAILKDASDIIGNMMARLHQFNPKTTGLSRKALEMSLTDLVDTEDSSHRSGLGGMA
ncbi:amino acid dehydrogenase [Bacteroidia bacterium]|nr:amino acid dehydrogenase [Bacteroidia bacterium]